MIRVQMDYAYACCGQEQPNNFANLITEVCCVAPEFNHGGRVQHRGRVLIVSAAFLKHSSAQGSLKFREVCNSFWEGTRREKTCLKKVS